VSLQNGALPLKRLSAAKTILRFRRWSDRIIKKENIS
jgi:hypothetical protein